MKITGNREAPTPPPLLSVTVELTPHEAKILSTHLPTVRQYAVNAGRYTDKSTAGFVFRNLEDGLRREAGRS